MADHDDQDVEFIRSPIDLSQKAPITPGGVDLEAIEKAEALIADLQDDYLVWAEQDAASLSQAFEALASNPPDMADAKAEVFRVAHDMKGQGGSFGYDLITQVGDQLCRFLEGLSDTPSRAEIDVLRVHVETMRMILSRRMQGDGGREGAMLMKGLQQTVQKVSG